MKTIQEIKDCLGWYERKGEHSDYAYLIGMMMEMCEQMADMQAQIDNHGEIIESVEGLAYAANNKASAIANGMVPE